MTEGAVPGFGWQMRGLPIRDSDLVMPLSLRGPSFRAGTGRIKNTRRCTVKRPVMLSLVLIAAAGLLLAACGGGGGGGAPSALAGIWTIDETVGTNSCAVPEGTSLPWSAEVAHQSGSNSITLQDTRPQSPPMNATISENVISYNGDRYNEWDFSCDYMTATYSLTLSGETDFEGTGTVFRHYTGGYCSLSTALTGSKN